MTHRSHIHLIRFFQTIGFLFTATGQFAFIPCSQQTEDWSASKGCSILSHQNLKSANLLISAIMKAKIIFWKAPEAWCSTEKTGLLMHVSRPAQIKKCYRIFAKQWATKELLFMRLMRANSKSITPML